MSIKVKVIKAAEPLPDHLEQFKQYASVPDDSLDDILYRILKRAMLTVQAFSDRAMLPCTLEMTVTDIGPAEPLKLYQGGKEIISVTDDLGREVEYRQYVDRIFVYSHCESLTVVYKNEIDVPEADALLPVCWELATAIYDGEDTKVQKEILSKVYGML